MSQPKTPDNTSDPAPAGGDTVLPVPDENRDSVPDGSVGQPNIIIQKPVNSGPDDKAMTGSIKPKF